MERKTALVLGATGGIGGSVARRLLAGGWQVRALVRGTRPRPDLNGMEVIPGDALSGRDVAAAADGAGLIVHAVNPPGYRDWARLVLPMLENSIAAATSTGARILLPGTVYNYGPDAFPLIAEDEPQRPLTRKGAIRVQMEQRLHTMAEGGRASALIVRAGDFFGPRAGNNWFSQALVTPGRHPSLIRNPGRPGVGHQWAYLPDVAETMVQLIEQGRLGPFERFHMDGHWDADGRQMSAAIQRVLGDPAVREGRLPWWALRLAAPFATTPRELLEMKYLWERPVRLTNARLLAHLGEEPRTPLDQAVRATLLDLGCV
ncbi:MAG: hypothetical protein DI568_08095 [Sphingomonas sp.]|nr:MAG: hypothetical protein DI568_08095 [Sphingomonas sp.]